MNLLEPWVLFRLAAGLCSALLFLHAGWVGLRILRFFHLRETTEGQLALERQAELGAASARVGAVVQGLALLLSVLSADRLTATIRGAMCGYGVVHANAAGPLSIGATVAASIGAGVTLQMLRLDAATRSLALVRPLARFSLVMAALSLVDLGLALRWLGGLDLSVVASCCSAGLDAGAGGAAAGYASGPRLAVTALSLALFPAAALLALGVSRAPGRRGALAAGLLFALAAPVGLAAAALEVAPHVYELPQHRCLYCLFRPDAFFLGYPLLSALYVAEVFGLSAALAAWLSPPADPRDPFAPFARRALRAGAWALLLALGLGALPVARYALLAPGASLFR